MPTASPPSTLAGNNELTDHIRRKASYKSEIPSSKGVSGHKRHYPRPRNLRRKINEKGLHAGGAPAKSEETGGQMLAHFRSLPTHKEDPFEGAIGSKEKREIGRQATWSLSSAKQGFGVEQLRDDNSETYWQSDGAIPHLINIQFPRKTEIEEVALYTDFKLDESYAPHKIAIRLGSNFLDLQDVRDLTLDEHTGWTQISLRTAEKSCVRAHLLQIAILSNHQNGRDTHVRQVKIYGPSKSISENVRMPHFESVEFTMYSNIR